MANSASKHKYFGISHAAAAVNKSESWLRELDRRGEIVPARTAAGHRIYTEADLKVIRKRYSK